MPWFIVGGSIFVFVDAVATFWFLFCTARCVNVDDQGVAVEWNGERKTFVPWDAIRVAQETSDLNGKIRKWTFECPEGNFVSRNDWIRASQWKDFSAAIVQAVTDRGHAIRTKGGPSTYMEA